MPLYRLIEAHVLAAQRLHGDDTTVPMMAKSKTVTARLWVYVRDDRPFAGDDPPAALFHYSRDRRGEHPRAHLASWSGILQADAYGGYGELYAAGRQPAPVLEAGCFAHARRKFFELADVEGAARKKSRGERSGQIYPIALEAVQKLDALFDIERGINGKSPSDRLAIRQELSAPLMTELRDWLTAQLARLSRNHDLAKAINYMVRRWDAFTRFLDDGRVCLTNNAAERALRCVPLGRKAWLFCGSDRGGQRAAVLYTLIQSALCRARHKQVYAGRRTMPSAEEDRARRQGGRRLATGNARHSFGHQRAFRKSSSRSLGRNRFALSRSYGLSLASAASLSSMCA